MTNQRIARTEAFKTFAAALKDRPLDPGKPEDAKWYVETLHLETDANGTVRDPIRKLARKIERAEGGRHVWLYTGNIGTGKSTELRRLKGLLKEAGHIPLLADAADYMHLQSPIEISDFLISISAAFAVEAGKLLGSNEVEEGYWRRIKNVLTGTQISVTEATASAALPDLGELEIKAAIRLDPTYKQRLQAHLQAHLSTLVKEVHALVEDIAGKLRNNQHFGEHAKIVLLFDNMERLRGSGAAADTVFTSLRRMFTQFHDMLRLPEIQVVYSVPPYLGRLEPQLYAVFGDATFCSLTYAHVFKFTQGRREIDTDGVKQLRELVARRYPDWESLLPEAELNRLIMYSGGNLRDLFRFISAVLLELEDDVAPSAAVEYVLAHVRRSLEWIVDQDGERLKTIARTKQLQRGSQAEMDAFVRDMETGRVLMYLNGEEWYDVHPLLWDTLGLDAAEDHAGG